MSNPKIFLDTSVLSAYFDFRKPVRQLITEKWIENELDKFDCYISFLVLNEIENNSDRALESKMKELINRFPVSVLQIEKEILNLASLYRQEILANEINDSIHLACASFYKLDIIVSWNFRHLVNFNTINTIHKINKQNNLNIIEILSPQNLGGYKYGNL